MSDHVSYSWYMMLFFNSEFHCGTKLTVHKIYISKLFLWNNRSSVTVEQSPQRHCGKIATVSLCNSDNNVIVKQS